MTPKLIQFKTLKLSQKIAKFEILAQHWGAFRFIESYLDEHLKNIFRIKNEHRR